MTTKRRVPLSFTRFVVPYDMSCVFMVMLVMQVHDTYFLVAIIDNEYVDSDMYAIFKHVMKQIKQDVVMDSADDLSEGTGAADEDTGLVV